MLSHSSFISEEDVRVVLEKYILTRWRKDIVKEYTKIQCPIDALTELHKAKGTSSCTRNLRSCHRWQSLMTSLFLLLWKVSIMQMLN